MLPAIKQLFQRPAGVAFLIVLGTFAIAVLALPPYYDTNDDPAMRRLAEGRLDPSGQPSMYILFMSLVVGRALATAYAAFPGLPWYDLHLMLGLLLSAGAVAFALLRLKLNALALFTAVCLFAALFFPAFVRFQFTIVSMNLGTAAAALFFSFAYKPPQGRRALTCGVAAVVAFSVWAALVRLDTVYVVLALVLPASLWLALAARRCPDRQRTLCWLSAGAIVAALAIYGFCRVEAAWYEGSDGWSDYPRFNTVRNQVAEYLDVDLNSSEFAAALEAVGWTKNDFLLLRAWGFVDPKLYSTERLETFQRLLRPAELQPLRLLRHAYWALIRHATNLAPYAALVLFIGLLGGRLSSVLFAGAMTVLTLLLLTAIEIYSKPVPFRVFFPVFALAATLAAIHAIAHVRTIRRWTSVISLLLLMAVVYALAPVVDWHATRQRQRAELLAEMKTITECRTCLKVSWAGGFPFEKWSLPFRSSDIDFAYLGIGSANQTPMVQNFLKARRIDDLLLWMCTEPDVEVVVGRLEFLEPIRQYLLEHYGRRATLTRLDGLAMYRFRCSAEPR